MDKENLGINKDELKIFEDMGAHTDKCPSVAGMAAAWAIDILWDFMPNDRNLKIISDLPSCLL